VNTRAHDLVVTLRGVLGTLPGATGFNLYSFRAWTYLLIATSTDATVHALGHDLGLGRPEIRAARTAWWLRAMSEPGLGEVRIEVAGPHHQGPPLAR